LIGPIIKPAHINVAFETCQFAELKSKIIKNSAVIASSETRNAVSAIRSLGRKQVQTIAVSSVAHAPGFYSKYTSRRILVPSYKKELTNHKDCMLKLAKRSDVLTILPMAEADVYVLCKWRNLFESYVRPLWATSETFELVRDRIKLLSIAENVGVPIPRTRLLSNWNDWGAPCVIKSRYSTLEKGNGLFYPNPQIIDTKTKPNYEKVTESMAHEPIVQEFVEGEEYGFFALYNEGRLKAKMQHRRLLSDTYMGGPSVMRISIYNKELDELGLKLLDALKWHGPAMVEFKFDIKEKKFKLMEINPRFWGSVNLAICAGVDFPYLYYTMARDGDCESVLKYKTGVLSHYSLGVLLHMISIVQGQYPQYVRKPSLLKQAKLLVTTLPHSTPDISDWRNLPLSFADLYTRAVKAAGKRKKKNI
jgi:predicted ATP-grasp superfamily ATP-dependent carboligase